MATITDNPVGLFRLFDGGQVTRPGDSRSPLAFVRCCVDMQPDSELLTGIINQPHALAPLWIKSDITAAEEHK